MYNSTMHLHLSFDRKQRARRVSRRDQKTKEGLRSTAAGGKHKRGAAVTTSSERDGGGSRDMLSEGSDGTDGGGEGLLNKIALKALRKLEGPAFDGSLRQAFNEQAGGRGRADGMLSRSHLKR